MKVTILKDIMNANDQLAARNRSLLDHHRVLAFNIMSSPGAGKTSLLLATIQRLKDIARIGVIEADIASTIDAEKINSEGVMALQINTGGQCHIDANMVGYALEKLPLKDIDLLFIENVGNLICPANFKIGAQKSIMLLSIPEGDDKPFKYPQMFYTADVVIISKTDYLPLSDFNLVNFLRTVSGMNPRAQIFRISAKTGEGMDEWIAWLKSLLKGD
jgi:hydrogenase nickel incorporation protein HypB